MTGFAPGPSVSPLATTWGKLYQLHAEFPALEVPESSILATGTADPPADARTQNTIQLPENAMTRPEGDWDLVHGELVTFANPQRDLPPIDRLEAIDPNGRCIYTRVLVVALNAKIGFSLAGHTTASIISSEAVCDFPVGTGTVINPG